MYKKILIFVTMVGMLFLSSCTLPMIQERLDMLNKDDSDKKADVRFEQVIEAIQNKDSDALKSMFSKQALAEAKNIDGGMDYLFEFFQGKVESWENDARGSDDSIKNGKTVMVEAKSWYKVTTDKDEYLFFLLEYSKDIENPDNVGLYSLRVIKAKDKETQFTYWQDMKIAGIYKPTDASIKVESVKNQ